MSVCAKTDWTGEYTLVGLASGEYKIEVFLEASTIFLRRIRD